MRSKVIRTLALALLLCGAVIGQQPSVGDKGGRDDKSTSRPKQKTPPAKSKLEDMLAEALKNNPDIRVAAAKLAEADAELNRTRLQVIQKVVALHHAILTQKAVVEVTQRKYDRVKALGQDRAVASQMVDEVNAELTVAKAKLEELEAQQPALLGKTPESEYTQTVRQAILLYEEALRVSPQTRRPLSEEAVREKTPRATGPMAEKIRKALSRTISVSFTNRPVKEVAALLSKESGLVIQFVEDSAIAPEENLSIRCDDLSLSAVLQLLVDSLPRHTILVRDYGLLIAPKKIVPPGAMTVQEFLRPKPAYGPGTTNNIDLWSSSLPWKVPEKIEGTIKKINADGSVWMSLNSVDGLLNGHTLQVYRPSDEPSKIKYLGTIRIGYVNPNQQQVDNEVRGQAVGQLSEPPKVGDKVSARLPRGGKNPPAESAEGLVKSVNASGLLKISIGSDAGLAKGHTLELFRLNPQSPKESKYLGTIRILEAQAKESVAQAVGRLADTPKVGDRVASRIFGK